MKSNPRNSRIQPKDPIRKSQSPRSFCSMVVLFCLGWGWFGLLSVSEGQAQQRSSYHKFRPGTAKSVRGVPHARQVWIPPGTFRMGSPTSTLPRIADETLRHVRISRGFWMWQTEVTQGQFFAITRMNPSFFKTCGRRCPVERVTWHEALLFAHRLSVRHRLPSCYRCRKIRSGWRCGLLPIYLGKQPYTACRGWRLPTEAEWEYAARAGSLDATYGRLDNIAWFHGNSREKAHPVARKRPNAWGLFDMLGNVAEWVWDVYEEYVPTATLDPTGPDKGPDRVFRGGGWLMEAPFVRAAYRAGNRPYSRYDVVGFRVVRTIP